MNNFSALVEQTTRLDGWVNATKWCQAYSQKWTKFRDEQKPLIRKINKKYFGGHGHPQSLTQQGVTVDKCYYSEGRGKNAIVWVHPILAIALAEWLNTDFSLFVKETLKRYLEGDITLADEIIQRQTDKSKIDWILERTEGKKTRMEFTDELQKRGVTGFGYAQNTDAIYTGIFEKKAQELKKERDAVQLRDAMSSLELASVRFAELLAIKKMQNVDAHGNKETTQQSKLAGKAVKQALDS